ncbi:MAG TPA: hypothetical protein VI547_13550 [Anaerolineales bacterium]|nr:hypothetical protein [Anaerolineales bacterium]
MEENASFQVLVEVKQVPPESGPFQVEAHFTGVINVSPVVARRRATGFVGMEVLMAVRMGEPVLVTGERLRWRVPIYFSLPGIKSPEPHAALGFVDVDASSGEVIAPSAEEIAVIRDRANVIASGSSRSAETTR